MLRRFLTTTAAAAALLAATPASADTVCDWMDLASRLGAAGQAAPGPRMPEAERATTRVALAMFEALNAIDRRYRSHLDFPAAAAANASQDAAAATAAFKVLLHHYPAQRTNLEESHALAMSTVRDEAAREAGRAIGEQAAAAAIAAGGIDAARPQTPFRPVTAPGVWIGAALPSLEPYWSAFRPWIAGPDILRVPPPPPLASARWARDYDEVRRLGGRTSTERTPHQTLVARYRQAFDVMPALRQVADAPGRTPVQNARMFAVYQMAFDDAATAMVVAKLQYNFWRPITAIRNGADDGNAATEADPAWVPLLPTPNFSEYPCGHCTVAATVAEVMKAETGDAPAGGVRIMSQAIPMSVVQTFPSWTAWAQEVSDSRIYGGVHFRFSNEAGEEIGRRAARLAMERALQPLAAAPQRRQRGR